MAVTQVSICNSALIKVGSDRISSISQDTKSAILLNAIWDQTRDSVLRAHPWNFAVKRDTLAPTGTEPAWGYDYEYDLPSDCLRLLGLDSNDFDYVVENGKILTDEDTLNVQYIYRNENMESWDSCFAEAFAWKLAKEIAYALTQSNALVEACEKAYRAVLAEARFADGSEGIIRSLEATDWTDARR